MSFEECFGDLDCEKVFTSMNKFLFFKPILGNMSEFEKDLLANYVYEDFYKEKYAYYIKYHTQFVQKVIENIFPVPMFSGYNMLTKILFYMQEKVFTKISFSDIIDIINVLKKNDINLYVGMPIILYKCVFDLLEISQEPFLTMVDAYYNAYYPSKKNISKEDFRSDMLYYYMSPKNIYFQHCIDRYIDMYKNANKIVKAYKSYRMRIRLPVVANKARLKDEIEYRPLTGIKYFEAKSFFENKEWISK